MLAKAPLRALVVDDDENDALLLARALRRSGMEISYERVDTSEGMIAALGRSHWDLVLSDYSMPSFSAGEALALVKARRLDVPFIIVSGTVNEEVAVEVIRAGAHDFMPKSQLSRLAPAIVRELREAALRRERAAIQEQLLIAGRMASMGMLAAGVAHEINNPLAALMANLDFALEAMGGLSRDLRERATDADDESLAALTERLADIEEPLRDATECADRVRQIVRDLKLFSRPDDDHVAPVDLHRVIESSLRMAWNEIRHRARLVKDYGSPPPVDASVGRLGQVFLNLLVNAAQAIPEGAAQQNEIRIVTRRDAEGHAVVEIRDTGCGMPKSVLERVFDPFFTTKASDEGTGLGLPICHGIVVGMGGRLELESEPGLGTVARVVFPRATRALVPRRMSSQTRIEALRRGRILVIDDEASLGEAIERILANDHDVEVTTHSDEALARLRAGARYDVILCDLLMPDGTGMDLHGEIARVDRDQADRVVFMTGGAFTPFARDFLDAVPNLCLEKPFDRRALQALVQKMLVP